MSHGMAADFKPQLIQLTQLRQRQAPAESNRSDHDVKCCIAVCLSEQGRGDCKVSFAPISEGYGNSSSVRSTERFCNACSTNPTLLQVAHLFAKLRLGDDVSSILFLPAAL